MAQDRGRYGERGNYETDDLRFRERQGFGPGRYSGDQGRSQQSGYDFSSGRQEGGWQDADDQRGYGQYGGGSEDWSRGNPSSFPGTGGYGGAYGGGRGSRERLGQGYGGERYYGGEQRYGGRGGSEGGRDFWDKASDEVSSWFGDDEAARRRNQDQHRGKGPKGYARSDSRITEDVNDRLTDDWSLDASNVEVKVSGREVTLSGEVSNRADKRRAEDIAESVSGVTHVQNNLRVRQQSTTTATMGGGGSKVI
jgi:osmotically-inducible protein OsmY